MNVLFTSDLHLGHALAAKNRGFSSLEEHDDSIIYTLLGICTKRSILWILGDIAWTPVALERLKEVPGHKHLIRGNHDKCGTYEYLKIFESIHGFLQYKQMWLSHCPIHPQELYRCVANVHGHIHKNTSSPLLPPPYLNVNWDFWGRPISLEEIRTITTSWRT